MAMAASPANRVLKESFRKEAEKTRKRKGSCCGWLKIGLFSIG